MRIAIKTRNSPAGSRRTGRLAAGVPLLLLVACGRSTTVADTPPPAPAPVMEVEALPDTLEHAIEARHQGKLELYERGLQAFALSGDPHVRRRSLAFLSLFYIEQKRDADAIGALRGATAAYPEIAPWLRLRLAEIEQRRGELAASIADTEAVIASAPGSAAATVARLRLPALYARNGDAAGTDRAYAVAASTVIDEFTESELSDLAAQLGAAGRGELARAIRMRLLSEYAEGRLTETTYADLAAAPSVFDTLPIDDTIQLASRLARSDRYDQTLDLLGRVVQRFPDAAKNASYRAVLTRSLFNSRNYDRLLEETKTSSAGDPALLLLRARAAWRTDRPEEFLNGLRDIEARYPGSPQAIEAKVLRAKYYLTDEKDHARSLQNLQAAIDAGAVGNDGENIWTLGWTLTLAGRDEQALKVYDRYIRSYPDGDYKTNSVFWSAKIFERLQLREERDIKLRQLIAEYPYSYYSYRAREIVGDPALPPSSIPGGASFPDIDAQLASITDPRLTAVREIAAVGLLREASREMKLVSAAFPDNLGAAFYLADLYVQAGEPFKANGVLQRRFRQFVRHGGANVPERFWQILFPRNYWEAIRTEAEKRQLDPYLLTSIIRQESGFEPTIVSNAGAVGLMQIMPQEAPRIASLAGLEGITREALFDPQRNVAVGAAEYAQKLGAMGGNHVLAIAAYNAGEEAVGRWLAQHANEDMDVFVESIPYAETRLYVKTVSRNRFEYRRIYERSVDVPQQPAK